MTSRILRALPLAGIPLALALGAPVFAQTAHCAANAQPRRIVLTIGINHYQHDDKWPLLRTAVNDADAIEQVLVTKFGYQSYESLAKLGNDDRLRDAKATQKAIESIIENDLPNDLRTLLCPGDDFVLFFSGHGDSRAHRNGEGLSGFLIPYDGEEEGVTSLINVKSFLEDIADLPAKHILVILDACHSGVAIQEALQGLRASGDYQAALASHTSRKVIVSAQPDQTASDSGSIPNHSLFGGLLYQALAQGLAAKGSDFIADSQLAEFVKEGVADENPNQLPDSAPFTGNDGGSLVLKLGNDLAGIYRNAMESLLKGNDDDFRQDANSAASRAPDDPMTMALQYRLALMDGKVEAAAGEIEKLRTYAANSHADSDSLPLSRAAMLDIRHQLNFWQSALAMPVTTDPPAVIIKVFTGDREDQLTPLSGSIKFSVDPEANVYFKLHARKESTYVYAFLVDKRGQIYPKSDFIRNHDNPIVPDPETLAVLCNGPESDDIEEWHFIFSPREIDASSSAPTAADLAGATHYVITIRPGS
jgi:uncharacterized caspase-like protein